MEKLINKKFSYFIYILTLLITLFLLYQARSLSLLPIPMQGTDQLTMLEAAVGMYYGHMPQAGYKMSPAYTTFLYFLLLLSGGKLLFMRIIQTFLAALIPVFIFKLSRRLRLGFQPAQIGALLYCFYGPAILISLDMLRASMLSLCFLLYAYCLIKGYMKKNRKYYILGGILAGVTILGRENFIPIVFVPYLALFFAPLKKHITKKHALIYSLALLLTLLPCLLYNYFQFNSFSIIPGNFDNVITCYHGDDLGAISDSTYRRRFLTNIPVQFCKFLSSYEIPNSLSFYAHKEIIDFMNIFIIPFNFLLILAIIGGLWNLKKPGILLISLLCAGYVGTMLFFNMFYRFRIPVVPLIITLGVAGIAKIMKNQSKKVKIAIACSIVLFSWLTYSTPNNFRTQQERISVARVMIQTDQLNKAENYLEELAKDSIFPEKQWLTLMKKLWESGDKSSAERVYAKYQSLKPRISIKKRIGK